MNTRVSDASGTVPTRNAGLDVLRGVAILLVVLHHLALDFRLPLVGGVLEPWLPRRVLSAIGFSGYEAVFVFFVLSGFLIARRVMECDGDLARMDWRGFYRARAARILPLLLLLLVVLSLLHLAGVPGFVIDRDRQSLAGALTAALGLHLNWYEGQTGWLPGPWDVLWSLSIEELFYLCFPLVCVLLPRGVRLVGLAVLVLSLPWTRAALDGQEIWQEKAYLPGMSAIALGVLCAELSAVWRPGARGSAVLRIAAGVGLCVMLGWGGELWQLTRHASFLVLLFAAAALILALHAQPPVVPRGTRWLADMGRCSYEIYLSHMFVVLLAVGVYRDWLGAPAYWHALVYPGVVWCCIVLGRGLERGVCRPAARYLRGPVRAR